MRKAKKKAQKCRRKVNKALSRVYHLKRLSVLVGRNVLETVDMIVLIHVHKFHNNGIDAGATDYSTSFIRTQASMHLCS